MHQHKSNKNAGNERNREGSGGRVEDGEWQRSGIKTKKNQNRQ